MINLLKSLQKVQIEIKKLKKDAYNPYFKSRYTSLNSIREELQPLLTKHGLVIIQPLTQIDGKLAVETKIVHLESGESLSSIMLVVAKNENDPQQVGSSISYARRYSLLSLMFLTQDDDVDDDGNMASGKSVDKEMDSQKTDDEEHKTKEVKRPTFKKQVSTKPLDEL